MFSYGGVREMVFEANGVGSSSKLSISSLYKGAAASVLTAVGLFLLALVFSRVAQRHLQ